MADDIERLWQVWDDWSGGEFGEKPLLEAAGNEFTGSNVVRYENGLLGPRPGLKSKSITGNVAGKVWGMFFVGVPSTGALAIVIADKVYLTSDDSDFTLTEIGTLSATPEGPVNFTQYDPNNQVYFTVPGGVTYHLSVDDQNITQILDKGGLAIMLWKDRLYVTGDRATPVADHPPWVVYFSEAADFTNFASNFFDLGYHWDGYAFASMANNLFIATRGEGWWALTGGSPLSGTLRLAYVGTAPGKQQEVVTENGQTWFWRDGYDGLTGIDGEAATAKLANTNGSVFDADTYQFLELGGERFGQYLPRRRHVLFTSSSGEGWIRNFGTWSKLDFEVDISGPLCNTFQNDRALLVGGDDDVTEGTYYSYYAILSRPGFTSDSDSLPGDDSNTPLDAYFRTGLFVPGGHSLTAPIGQSRMTAEVRPRTVIVEFQSWDTGSPDDNYFTLEVNTYVPYGPEDMQTETQFWTEPGSDSPATEAGMFRRARFGVGAKGWGAGFQIGVLDMKGVAVRRILVEYESNAARQGLA